MKGAIRPMIRKRGGRIVNIVSVVGLTGNAGQANYSASKAGMIGLAKSLAREVGGRGITVNCVAPGFIVTPMTDSLPDDVVKQYHDTIPAGRFGSVEEVAAAVRFLVSDEASYVTGQTIHVNGGMLMVLSSCPWQSIDDRSALDSCFAVGVQPQMTLNPGLIKSRHLALDS